MRLNQVGGGYVFVARRCKILAPGTLLRPHFPRIKNWVAVKELKLSYHNGYIYIYSK